MAWYQDSSRKTYVATYQNDKVMRAEVEAAAQFGFLTQAIAHNRSQITVTYQRDERAWARIQVETALSQLQAAKNRTQAAQTKTFSLTNEVATRLRAARNETSNPTQLEQKLLKAISDCITARQAAISESQSLMSAYALLTTARDEAAKLHVVVPQAEIDVPSEYDRIRAEIEQENIRLGQDQSLRESQQRVVSQVQTWQKAVGDRWGARSKLAGAEKALARASTATTGATSAGSHSQTAEAKRAQHQARLAELDGILQEREAALLTVLEGRDKAMQATSSMSV